MKLSDKLLIVANWLEDSENDLIVNAENDENHLTIVAATLCGAASLLKIAAEEVAETEPVGAFTMEQLDELATLAAAFDESGDELLCKQASVLDELLITLAAPKGSAIQFRETQDDRIEELKKKYRDTKSLQDEMNKVSDSVKAIEKSPAYKQYRPMEFPLSMRTCPDHSGIMVIRIGNETVQCPLDKKIYNYETGYTLLSGSRVPGSDVSQQTKGMNENPGHTVFDDRNSRMGQDGDI